MEDGSGNLFGTSEDGGLSGYGMVFEVAAGSGVVTTLASFNAPQGANPNGGLVEDGSGNLFGTTGGGGSYGNGTVFEIAAGSGAITTLASFNGTNGASPGGLIDDGSGNLFGATFRGGSAGYGTVFEVAAHSGVITTLASFNGNNGAYPNGGLVEDSSGNLFGTTEGLAHDGRVFEVAAHSGAITTLASFNSQNGYILNGGLVEDSSGNLFGTTYGTVFEIAAHGSVVTTLASFNGSNGVSPTGGLAEDSSGNLFGTTYGGGSYGFGTVFEIAAGSRAITTLASFAASDVEKPRGGLIEDSNGNLFGVTSDDYTTFAGTAFELVAGSGVITTLANISGTEGEFPQGGLIEDRNGNLFGEALDGGPAGYGTVFEIPALSASALTPPVATEGVAFGPVSVFHFNDTNPDGTASDYTATVQTGDTTLTSAANPSNVRIVADLGGGFDVQLSYTYAEALSNQTFGVQVTDVGGASTSASTSDFSVAGASSLTLWAASGQGTYGGTVSPMVTLMDNGTPLANETVSFSLHGVVVGMATTDSNGLATLTGVSLAGLGAGTYSGYLGASFAGDADDPGGSTTGDLMVNKADLTVSADGQSKIYDGTSAAVVTLSDNRLAGDVLNDSYATATFADQNVGSGKTVSVSGIVIGGPAAGNYQLVSTTVSTTADITARAITVTAIASARVYDGTTSSTVTPTITSGSLAAGDTAVFTEVFDTRNVGTGKTLTAVGSVNDGNGGSNYSLSFVASTAGAIATRVITVTAVTSTKVYDGATSSTVTPTITSGSLAADDTAAFSETFSTRNTGTGRTLTAAGSVNDGNSGSNYTVTLVATNTTGQITPLAVTVTAATSTKVYDGTTCSAIPPTITTGNLATGDAAAFIETFDTRNVGTGKTLTAAGSVSDGNGGSNYTVTLATNTAGQVTPQAITVTAATATKVYDGTTASMSMPTIADAVTTLAGYAQTGSSDGVGSAARFWGPEAVAVDSAGNIYVADVLNQEIRKISPSGVVTTLAGSAGQAGSSDGTGSAARFDDPQGVAVDSAGNVYVADELNEEVRKISPSGVVTTLAGSAGQTGSSDDTGNAARFYQPVGVAVDSAGNLYVADLSNDEIREITPSGVVSTLAGSAAQTGSSDGTGSAARFDDPEGVAVDSAGNIYVADYVNAEIREITPSGMVTTLAGSPEQYGSTNGTGSTARFNGATGVAVDSAGNLYVADLWNDEIRRISPSGVVTTLAGSPGQLGFADGTGSAASFYWPNGVAVDSEGNVCVADGENDEIRSVSPSGVVTTLAGVTGYGSSDGIGSAARFEGPFDVAVDSAGNVYVADQGNEEIRKITPSGVVTTLAGSAGHYGSLNGTGSAARFDDPMGVAVDSAGNVYVADQGNEEIRKITPSGVVTTLAGSAGQQGSLDGTGSAARFRSPTSLAVDSAGNVYVADGENDEIRKITPSGVVTTLAGSAGQTGSSDGTGNAARFSYPDGVALDNAGNVYVADTSNDEIRKITPSGVVTTLAGSARQTGSSDGAGSAARFASPQGVAVDRAGNVYVADTSNEEIREITPLGIVTTLAGSAGKIGSSDGAGGAARFYLPYAVAVDNAGDLYVADTDNNEVRLVSGNLVPGDTAAFTEGFDTKNAGTGKTLTASGSVADGNGGSNYTVTFVANTTGQITPRPITVAATTCTKVYDGTAFPTVTPTITPGSTVTTLAGSVGQQGSSNGTGSAATFFYPFGVAVDSVGNVYVADEDNDEIRKITPSGVVTTLAGSAKQTGSSNGTGSAARFDQPMGIAVDSAGNVYVADETNDEIRKITPSGVVTTLAGSAGQMGSSDGTGSAARFSCPKGVAVDSAGNVYVSETDFLIRKITPSGVVTTLAGAVGQAGSVNGTGSAARFNNPTGVAVDSAGNVYVADEYNDEIRQISPSGVVTTLAGSAGQTGSSNGSGSAARFYYHSAVAVDSAGNVYVAEWGNDLLREINFSGVVTTLAGSAEQTGSTNGTPSAARFNEPMGVAVDSQGNVYVADYENQEIREISSTLLPGDVAAFTETFDTRNVGTGKTLTVTGSVNDGNGGSNYAVTLIATNTTGSITVLPITVTTAAATKVYDGTTSSTATPAITAGSLAMGDTAAFNETFDTRDAGTGKTLTAAGSINDGNGGSNYALTLVATNTTGQIMVRAIVVTAAASTKVYDGTTSSTATPTITTPDEVTTLAGSVFFVPWEAALDSAGNVYVADMGLDEIFKVTPSGVVTTLAGSADQSGSSDGTGSAARFFSPYGVAVDSAGNVYVADSNNDEIREISPSGVVTTLAGSAGQHGSSDGTGTAARFSNPGSVAVDSAGNVYVTDYSNQEIRKITPSGVVTTLAGSPHQVGSIDGTGSAARFDNPTGIAVDSASNVYVADEYNDEIREITSSGAVTTLAGSAGQAGSADGTGSAAQFDWPEDVAVDNVGNVYVADMDNDEVRAITPSGIVTTLAGSAGQTGSSNGAVTAARFNRPTGLAVDSEGNIYVADSGNGAIRLVSAPGPVTGDTAAFTESFDTRNAGAGKTLTPAGSVNDGHGGNNYTVSFVANTSGVINQVAMTITAASNTRTYDGTTSAAATPTVNGLQGSDTVTGLIETYSDGNAGTGETLNVTGYTVNDGNSGKNYSVSLVSDTTGVINKANATIQVTPYSVTYNGAAQTATGTVMGVLGESLSGLDVSGTTRNNAGVYNSDGWTFTDVTGNYANASGTVNDEIDQAALTIAAVANTKTYDGTTASGATPAVSGLQGGDSVSGLVETYADANAGSGETLHVTGYTVNDGDGGNNYTVSTVDDQTGVINQVALTITADNQSRAYGAANPSLTYTLAGFVNGDTAGVVSGVPSLWTTAAAASNPGVYPIGITANTLVANNYSFDLVAGALTITKANPTIQWANPAAIVYGARLSPVQLGSTVTVPGPAGAGAVSYNPATGTMLHAGSGQVLTVTVAGTTDYNAASAQVTLNVLPAPLTITANSQSKVYGAALPTLTASYSGLVNGDSPASLTTPPVLSTTATTASHVGTCPIQAAGAVDPNYTISYANGTLTVTPTPVVVSVTPLVTNSRPTFTLTGTAVGPSPNAGIATVSVLVNGKTTPATISGNTWSASLSTPPAGTYNVQVTATDNAGNSGTATATGALVVNAGTTLSLSGTSFAFTGGLTPANWTVLVNGSKVTNIPATTTAVTFTGTGASATATITGASAKGESAAIAPGKATFNGVGSSGPYTVTATSLFSATLTSGGSGALSVTDASGGNVLTESPSGTALAKSGNSAQAMVANGFGNVIATATGAGSSTVANLFGSNAADHFTASPLGAVMQPAAGTAYRLEADGFATVRGTAVAGGDTALLTDAAGGTFNATGADATLSGTGYSIVVNNFASVQATAVGPSDTASLQASPGSSVFSGSKGKSEFKAVNYDNVANGFFTVSAYGATVGSNMAVLTDSAGNATATLNPQTATLTDATANSAATYQIKLMSAFQVIQAFETSMVGKATAIFKGSSTAANSFTSTATDATLAPSTGATFREYAKGFATVRATSTYATDTAAFYDSAGNDTFTATPTSATMGLATGKTVIAAGFRAVNAYCDSGGADTANLAGTSGADTLSLWSSNALLKMSTGNTVRAWYFANYNLDGGGGSDTVTTMDASLLWTKQTAVTGAKIVAWLANFAEINEDYSPGSKNTNKSCPIAVDQVLTAYWS